MMTLSSRIPSTSCGPLSKIVEVLRYGGAATHISVFSLFLYFTSSWSTCEAASTTSRKTDGSSGSIILVRCASLPASQEANHSTARQDSTFDLVGPTPLVFRTITLQPTVCPPAAKLVLSSRGLDAGARGVRSKAGPDGDRTAASSVHAVGAMRLSSACRLARGFP